MNKKEILEKSRKENKRMDEMELSALYRSGYVASIVGGLLCICLPLLESALMHKINNGTWIVFLAMDAAAMLIKYFYSRKKKDLIIGLILSILDVWIAFSCSSGITQ